MFADDTCLYVVTEDNDASAACLNRNLVNVKAWADQWLVTFNPNKTKSMLVSNKKCANPPLYYDGKLIEDVQQHKHLGVVLTDKLSWNDHTSSLIQSVSKFLDVMYKLYKDIDRVSLEKVYHTFVRLKLEYACLG